MKWILGLALLLPLHPMRAEVSQDEVNDVLTQMVREHVISQEEADKARHRMRTMKPEQWKQLNAKGEGVAAQRAPASVASSNHLEEVHKVDLDGAQFKQIQDDIKHFAPQYKGQ